MTHHEYGPDNFLDGLELGVWDEEIEYYIPLSEWKENQVISITQEVNPPNQSEYTEKDIK